MKRNKQNQSQGVGYPPQNGYTQGTFPGGMQPYQGYPSQQNGNDSQGYPLNQSYPQGQYFQQSQGYPPVQGYSQGQGYSQAQVYQPARNYQTPQVTGSQPPVSQQNAAGSYSGQGSAVQNAYPAQSFGQMQTGYQNNAYMQQSPYQQQNAASQQGYNYTGNQPPAGSYIPQTPYSQGYTSPNYQPPGNFQQGYSAIGQMGRQDYAAHQMSGQVPLNGGGYVPPPVPVRRNSLPVQDTVLLAICVALLILFALGMFAPGLGILKWVFLALSAGTIAVLWFRKMTEKNKRLCWTIVFGLLMLVTVISIVTASPGGRQSDPEQGTDPVNRVSSVQTNVYSPEAAVPGTTETPSVTNTPEQDENSEVTDRLRTFFSYWGANRQDDMLTLCSPSWKNKVEDPKKALFGLMANRTPKSYEEESISGTVNDTSRTVTITSKMDRNNGKDPIRYRLSVIMVKENDGLWYVDPQSLQTYDNADTPDPSITNTPAPTDEPPVYPDTVLYYNPSGGEYYHRDQNCKRINERYLPLQGHFTYAELDSEKYSKLKPCAICGAPSKGQ